MSSQKSLVAEQVRLQQWAAQIQDCKNRPVDMKVETWCSEHGITKANYYYRLKRVRKACLEVYNLERAFVELPQPTEKALPQEDSSLKPTAILRNSRGLALEIYNPVSKDMLQCILEVLSNAERRHRSEKDLSCSWLYRSAERNGWSRNDHPVPVSARSV